MIALGIEKVTARKPRGKSTSNPETVRSPQNLDVHVGKRIRMRRSLLGISQEKLAEAVGVTFQQVQKYERGVNRVSASRLFQIGEVLDVPVAYFYSEYGGPKSRFAEGGLADAEQEPFAGLTDDNLLYSKETADLLRAYYSLEDENKRRELQKIIKSMVESMR